MTGANSLQQPGGGPQRAIPGAGRSQQDLQEDEDEEVVEEDPSHRFSRYDVGVGRGRFKQVYKGFDEKQGIDVAWSKVLKEHNQLSDEQMASIAQEMRVGLDQDHPNIIRCYKCWQDSESKCINLVTEFFTSGNLREYRQRHKQRLDSKAVRKWARQVLLGLHYLHSKSPPIIHGDLRCDKIYINGHSGEIKIGDLGLATLLPTRFEPSVLPDGGVGRVNQYTRTVDVFAFGLVVLELTTLKRMDHWNRAEWPQLLESVLEPDAKVFIARCLGPAEQRPTVAQLLEDPFFTRKPLARAPSTVSESTEMGDRHLERGSERGDRESESGSRPERPPTDMDASLEVTTCQVGTVSGEDYHFRFSGKIREGKLFFRLNMEYEGDEEVSPDVASRTIDFVYDPDSDTADEVAEELGNQFNLSTTDRDICAAALKEWLAKELPTGS